MKMHGRIMFLFIAIICIGLSFCVVIPSSYGWLADSLRDDTPDMVSYIHKSYFESGDGTSATQYQTYDEQGNPVIGEGLTSDEGCAFEIKYPVQLYYFAWLQALGYFNIPNDGENTINQIYFYLSEDLDMTGWILPQTGTQTYPFVGNLDGNGHTISNLTIQNVEGTGNNAWTDKPGEVGASEIVGFFGVVGSLNQAGTVNAAIIENLGDSTFTPDAGYTYSSSINEVKNFILDGVTVKTETDDTLIGVVAGYVNGTVSGVAVSDSDIVVQSGTDVLTYTDNISDYSLIGYCTDPYKYMLNVSKVTLHGPTETQNIVYKNIQGEGAGFGGSIKMSDLFTRLTNVRSNLSSRPTTAYTTAETVIRDENGDVVKRIIAGTDTPATDRRYYSSDGSGMYYFYNTNTTFLYMYQETLTATNLRRTGETRNGYTISDGTNYLNLNSTSNGITTSGDPTIWVYENNRLYTYSETDGAVHYLNASTTALSVGTTGSTTWTWDGDHFSFTNNGMSYYLHYDNGWTVVQEYYYVISDGNGNYLSLNNSGGITNVTNSSQASHWTFGTNNNGVLSGTISAPVGNTTYYLRYYNNALTTYSGNTAGNRTSWTNDGSSLYYRNYNTNYYIRFNGSNWVAGTLGTYYAIRNGTDYLNITAVNGNTATLGTGDSIADISSDSGHTLWSFSTTGNNPSGTISATVNGTTYYLNDNNGTLAATTTNNTSWTNTGSSIGNGRNYLSYNDEWTIETIDEMAIRSGNYYLNITATNGANATLGTGNSIATDSVSNHTVWHITDSGRIYAEANGNTYYLRNNNGSLVASTTDYNGWTVGADNISSGEYYLSYQSNTTKWVLLPYPSYTINRGGTYLNMTGTTATSFGSGTSVADWTDSSGHTIWKFSTTGTYPAGTIYTMYNGTPYYLYCNGTNLNLSTTNSTTWTNSNNTYNRLSARINNNTYYLYYRNNTWGIGTSTNNSRANMTMTSVTVPVVAFSIESTPSVTVNSETEPVHSQPEVIYNTLTDITRESGTVYVLVNEGTSTENSDYASAFPINVYTTSPYAANPDTNTGYFVAGGYSAASQSGRGDIRVSQYAKTNIAIAYGNTSTTNVNNNTLTDARLEVITGMDNGTYSGWYRVSDSFNSNNNNISTNISNVVANNRKIDYKVLGLKRYEDARQSLSETFANNSNIYGLHFMNSAIDINHTVTLPKAYIEGEEYTDYPVPNSSVDFNVKRRGFITVFAGTYYNGNDAFFSLHEIKRYTEDDPEVIAGTKAVNDLKEIKEISQIYHLAVGSDFVFKYTDGTYSSSEARGALAFDMKYMTNPTNLVNNAVYYFEIPVNSGEYALGSVDGKTGAYLFYLDIAANAELAEDMDRVTISEKFIDESYSVELPRGVQLVESGEGFDDSDPYSLATVELKDGYSGTYPLVRTGDIFTYTDDNNSELTYVGGKLSAQTGSGGNASEYVYYPNGYEVRFVEHITDKGRDTDNYDHMLVVTTDSYNTGGTRTLRTVKVYADVEHMEVGENVDEDDLDLVVTFTYNPSGHDNMTTRVVRASSYGGFNIAFDENLTLASVVIDREDVHINFGDTFASTIITATATLPLPANYTIPAVDMSGAGDTENTYFASAFGSELATYISYYEGEGVNVTPSTVITMSKLDPGNAAQTRSLTYAVTLTPDAGVSSVKVYGRKLINSYNYTTKVFDEADGFDIIDSGTITVNVNDVTINGTSLGTTTTEITINGS